MTLKKRILGGNPSFMYLSIFSWKKKEQHSSYISKDHGKTVPDSTGRGQKSAKVNFLGPPWAERTYHHGPL